MNYKTSQNKPHEHEVRCAVCWSRFSGFNGMTNLWVVVYLHDDKRLATITNCKFTNQITRSILPMNMICTPN